MTFVLQSAPFYLQHGAIGFELSSSAVFYTNVLEFRLALGDECVLPKYEPVEGNILIPDPSCQPYPVPPPENPGPWDDEPAPEEIETGGGDGGDGGVPPPPIPEFTAPPGFDAPPPPDLPTTPPPLPVGGTPIWTLRRIGNRFFWIFDGKIWYSWEIPAAFYNAVSTSTGYNGWWTVGNADDYDTVTVNNPPQWATYTAYLPVLVSRGDGGGLSRVMQSYQWLATVVADGKVSVTPVTVNGSVPLMRGDGKWWVGPALAGKIYDSGLSHFLKTSDADVPDASRSVNL